MLRQLLFSLCIAAGICSYGFELLKGTIDRSKVYPGTVHSFTVSVPEGYDGSAPACLYVGLDGALYNAPTVIDSLISAKKMPVTVGVYFQPGVVKDKNGNTVRYNRSNEYDAVDGRLAKFIETELLPAAKSLRTSAGLPVLISDNPDDHAISGASSGGIGAFVTAWQRPDLFRRVFTTCGTFVAMRGGDLLPAIARKTEPVPLRIFMHDGSRDAWNPLFGHWYEQNRLLASSLDFAGYDLMTNWDDSGHDIRPGARLFPEVMTWLWRDYPAGLSAGKSQNNRLSSLLATDSGWQRFTPSSEALPFEPLGNSATYPDSTYQVRVLEGTQWIEAATAGEPQSWQKACLLHDLTFTSPDVVGLAFDTDGNLYAATSSGIQVCDQNGRVRAILRYPQALTPTAFGFTRNELWVKMADGSIWSRTLNATAAPKHRIDVKSQGAS